MFFLQTFVIKISGTEDGSISDYFNKNKFICKAPHPKVLRVKAKNFNVTFQVYKYVTQSSGLWMILKLNGSKVTLTVTRGSRVTAMNKFKVIINVDKTWFDILSRLHTEAPVISIRLYKSTSLSCLSRVNIECMRRVGGWSGGRGRSISLVNPESRVKGTSPRVHMLGSPGMPLGYGP